MYALVFGVVVALACNRMFNVGPPRAQCSAVRVHTTKDSSSEKWNHPGRDIRTVPGVRQLLSQPVSINQCIHGREAPPPSTPDLAIRH